MLGALHSLPVPVSRRSQKVFKPAFFEQLKRAREASDAAWAISDWFSRVSVSYFLVDERLTDLRVRKQRGRVADGIKMTLCAKLV